MRYWITESGSIAPTIPHSLHPGFSVPAAWSNSFPRPKKLPKVVVRRVRSSTRINGPIGSTDARRSVPFTEYLITSSVMVCFEQRFTQQTAHGTFKQLLHTAVSSSCADRQRSATCPLPRFQTGGGVLSASHSQSITACKCGCQPFPMFVTSIAATPPCVRDFHSFLWRNFPKARRRDRTLSGSVEFGWVRVRNRGQRIS